MSDIPREILLRLQHEYGINSLVLEDFSFTSQIAPDGDFHKYYGKELAIYRLAVLLSILEGSYLHDPELGVNIIRYIFKPMNEDNIEDIKNELEVKINRYEKDFRLNDITVNADYTSKSVYFTLDLKYIPSKEDITLDFEFVKSIQALMIRAR